MSNARQASAKTYEIFVLSASFFSRFCLTVLNSPFSAVTFASAYVKDMKEVQQHMKTTHLNTCLLPCLVFLKESGLSCIELVVLILQRSECTSPDFLIAGAFFESLPLFHGTRVGSSFPVNS